MTVSRRDEVVLEVRSASKMFGAVTALRSVSLELHAGEVLALLGDNGAGKSTLIKCISGVHHLDGGEILIDGRPVTMRSPSESRRNGIETVYQDLALFDNLNVEGNFFAGREISRWGWLRRRQMRTAARETLAQLQVNLPGQRQTVGLLSGGQRQAIAVARAVAFAQRVVILDEPTAALGVRESGQVLELVKRLPQAGVAVILISHNLEQVMEVADRAMVLRRGSNVGQAPPDPDHHDQIVAMIVGAHGAQTER